MFRLTSLTASALAVAALATAGAEAASAGTQLRGAPQLEQLANGTVKVTFTNDDPVRKARVAIAEVGSATKVEPAGRHGNDYRYVARVAVDEALEIGSKHEVRIAVNGDDSPAERLAVVKEPAAYEAKVVNGPHGTKIQRPDSQTDAVDFVVRAGDRAVSGYVRILSAQGSRQFESEPFRLKAGRTFRLEDRQVTAGAVRVIYDIGARGAGDRTRVTFDVTRPTE